jgi:hypothetical protein
MRRPRVRNRGVILFHLSGKAGARIGAQVGRPLVRHGVETSALEETRKWRHGVTCYSDNLTDDGRASFDDKIAAISHPRSIPGGRR